MTKTNYSEDGVIFSNYTKEPAKLLTIKEAALQCDVTPRTFKRWLKTIPHKLRHLTFGKEQKYIDCEVQWWFENIVRGKKPTKTWKRSVSNLKKLILVNRQTILSKLEERLNHEWTDIQKKANKFGDSQIAAYRRGVRDAMYAVQSTGIESWDYVPAIGQHVWVGGCTGEISNITESEVFVSGTYHYCDIGGEGGYSESWRFSYSLDIIRNSDIRPWWTMSSSISESKRAIIWDYEHIAHN